MRAKQVCARAGCTYRQFDYWRGLGLFGADRVGLGSGGHNDGRFDIYDDDDVLTAAVAVEVIRLLGPQSVAVLTELAYEVHEGGPLVTTSWSRYVHLVIDVEGLRAALGEQRDEEEMTA